MLDCFPPPDDVSVTRVSRYRRPWERSGLIGVQMNHHHGDLGVSLRTPWMTRMMVRHLLTEWRAPVAMIDVAMGNEQKVGDTK